MRSKKKLKIEQNGCYEKGGRENWDMLVKGYKAEVNVGLITLNI